MRTTEDRQAVADLREKYVRLRRLRALHARALADPTFIEPDPRFAMKSLAAAWPGSLRELDELTTDDLSARVEALGATLAGVRPIAPWMTAQLAFHRLARGALCAKRWVANRGKSCPSPAAFAEAVRTEPHAQDALAWQDALVAIARPPEGRLMNLVFARLALELKLTEAQAKRLVFPHHDDPHDDARRPARPSRR